MPQSENLDESYFGPVFAVKNYQKWLRGIQWVNVLIMILVERSDIIHFMPQKFLKISKNEAFFAFFLHDLMNLFLPCFSVMGTIASTQDIPHCLPSFIRLVLLEPRHGRIDVELVQFDLG